MIFIWVLSFAFAKAIWLGVTDVVLVERESDRVSKSPHHHRVHHEHGSRKAPPLAYLIFGLQIGLLAKSPDWIHPLLLILEARSVHWTDTQSHSISMLMMMSTLQLHTRLLPFHLRSRTNNPHCWKMPKKSHFTSLLAFLVFSFFWTCNTNIRNVFLEKYVGVQSWKAAHLLTLEIRVEQKGNRVKKERKMGKTEK